MPARSSKAQEFSGIKLTVIPSKSQGALYDLHVFLVLRNEGWRLACEYNTDLYEATTITRLLTDFKILLENIVQDPNRPLSSFPVSEGAQLARQKRPAIATPAKANGRAVPRHFRLCAQWERPQRRLDPRLLLR